MAKPKRPTKPKVVQVVHAPSPDAEERLRRAFDILLDSAVNADRGDEHEEEQVKDAAPKMD